MATTIHAAVPSLIKRFGSRNTALRTTDRRDAPLPQIGPDHVLAKVRYAGVTR